MGDVTQLLQAVEDGDSQAAERLLPIVYDQLRQLAARRLSRESPGHTLEATALVHEAYVRLVDKEKQQEWSNRHHFFAAAAEAMRRILVERARHKGRAKHGGQLQRVDAHIESFPEPADPAEVLAIHAALEELEQHDQQLATLVKLRYFTGMGHAEAAAAMGNSRRVADRQWALARAWLCQKLGEN
jgi:RNA polymerase sigma factor (TIGR02999 family)